MNARSVTGVLLALVTGCTVGGVAYWLASHGPFVVSPALWANYNPQTPYRGPGIIMFTAVFGGIIAVAAALWVYFAWVGRAVVLKPPRR